MSYLQFEQIGRSDSGKTRIIVVRDRSGGTLGAIIWHAPWRKYTFAPNNNTVFDRACLVEIGNMCAAYTQDHRGAATSQEEGTPQ